MNLAANEGARSFVYDSQRERTPQEHARREHLRDLSVEQIREMYRQSLDQLLKRVVETKEVSTLGLAVAIVVLTLTLPTRCEYRCTHDCETETDDL